MVFFSLISYQYIHSNILLISFPTAQATGCLLYTSGTGTSALSLLVSFNLYAILIQLPPHDTGTESG